MQQFTILNDGRLADSVVLKSIESLREDVPQLSESAVECHMMLFRTYAAYFTAISERYEELGLSHARFNMLRWLHHADGNRLTITELGAGLEASVPNVIRLVQALEADGWIRRQQSPSDRRVVFVELTEDGHRRFRELLPRALELWEEVQSGLSNEEQVMLSHLLAKLRMSLLSRYIGRDLVSYRIEARRRKRQKAT
ncbi:MAG TPA: MarR family transcriptional regulator [Dehalococcoidia bacterium]|nr:MarR family transcriptional regulator [Dehalococcoidia bacterium]